MESCITFLCELNVVKGQSNLGPRPVLESFLLIVVVKFGFGRNYKKLNIAWINSGIMLTILCFSNIQILTVSTFVNVRLIMCNP